MSKTEKWLRKWLRKWLSQEQRKWLRKRQTLISPQILCLLMIKTNKISLTEHFNLQNTKLQHTKTETIKQYDST